MLALLLFPGACQPDGEDPADSPSPGGDSAGSSLETAPGGPLPDLPGTDTDPGSETGAPPEGTGDPDPGPPPHVFLITIDTVNRDFMGRNTEWATTPAIDALAEEGVYLDKMLSTRSLTTPSLATIHTGLYPRNHGLRENKTAWEEPFPSLLTRAQEAGYHTYGFSENQCSFVDYSVDERHCIPVEEHPEAMSQHEGDGMMKDKLISALEGRPPDTPLFVWIHFMDPHDPYSMIHPWYEEFHPEPSQASFNISNREALVDISTGDREYSEEDQEHLEAGYASQIRATDEFISSLLEYLRDEGLYDRSIVAVGSDHGEELALHDNYFFHDCSFYNATLHVDWVLRAPGTLPEGLVWDTWVSTVDIAPTLVDLMGLEWTGDRDGRSLVAELQAGEPDPEPVFFERGLETAGVVYDGHKYVLNPLGEYDDCPNYNGTDDGMDGDPVEIYDLENDPKEQTNLAETGADSYDEYHQLLCTWLTAEPWTEGGQHDADSTLLAECGDP